MSEFVIPELDFPYVTYGKLETPWNLRPLLYVGGAAYRRRKVMRAIADGELGRPIERRLPVVVKFHDDIDTLLTKGGKETGKSSTNVFMNTVRRFFAWADERGEELSVDHVVQTYLEWTEHLIKRQRLREISARTVYTEARTIATSIGQLLDLPLGAVLKQSRVRHPRARKSALGREADKQNLEDTFAFGHAICDIARALTSEAISAPLPLIIPLRCGKSLALWCGIIPDEKVKAVSAPNMLLNGDVGAVDRGVRHRRALRAADGTLSRRFPLINLRIEAELHIFLAQTGINYDEARRLRMGKFVYQSFLDGYQVRRAYKGRKKGEVEFEIYAAYREHFERYMTWRRTVLPEAEAGLLFPFAAATGKDVAEYRIQHALKRHMRNLEIPYFGPRRIRKTRVNWYLRKSKDPDLTAEVA